MITIPISICLLNRTKHADFNLVPQEIEGRFLFLFNLIFKSLTLEFLDNYIIIIICFTDDKVDY